MSNSSSFTSHLIGCSGAFKFFNIHFFLYFNFICFEQFIILVGTMLMLLKMNQHLDVLFCTSRDLYMYIKSFFYTLFLGSPFINSNLQIYCSWVI